MIEYVVLNLNLLKGESIMLDKNDAFKKLPDGEKTKKVNELLSFLNDDDDNEAKVLTREYLESLRDATPFKDGINKRLAELGIDTNISVKDKVEFILTKCQKHGIPTDSSTAKVFLSKPTLTNWLTTAPPNDRKKVFLLCFALEMDFVQCNEFFLKSFLSRPFNFKDTTEAVYFYCFYREKTYSKAVELLNRVEAQSKPSKSKNAREIATVTIGEDLCEILDEDELIAFLVANQFDKQEQHVTIRKEIERLLQDNKRLATKERKRERYATEDYDKYDQLKQIKITTDEQLLDQINGFKSDSEQNLKLGGIANSNLPKLIASNLPTRQNLVGVLKGTANDDMYRKTLELLFFYNYYAEALIEQLEAGIYIAKVDLLNFEPEKQDESYYEEFKMQLDELLEECGYLQLYVRHPFDWLMLYCARHTNPLDAWRSIIYNYYLIKADVLE